MEKDCTPVCHEEVIKRDRVLLTVNALDKIAKATKANEQAYGKSWLTGWHRGEIVAGELGSIQISGGPRRNLREMDVRLSDISGLSHTDYRIDIWPVDIDTELRGTEYGTYWINREGDMIRTFPTKTELITPQDVVMQQNGDYSVVLDRLDSTGDANFTALAIGFKLVMEDLIPIIVSKA